METPGVGARRLLAIAYPNKLRRIAKMLNEEFFESYGIRSISKYHESHYTLTVNEQEYRVDYEPGESSTEMFWHGTGADRFGSS